MSQTTNTSGTPAQTDSNRQPFYATGVSQPPDGGDVTSIVSPTPSAASAGTTPAAAPIVRVRTTPNTGSSSQPIGGGLIRDIQQSVQYRDVTKQASDVVVYIDGADYLTNPYLGDRGVTVAFNDFVNSWSSSYDLDSMVPSGTLTLQVPLEDDHLFRFPGGNNLLNTMMGIQVFAKGYYLSAGGNTVYRQIFKGFLSQISYSREGAMISISVSCFGALGILERMQIEQNPAVISGAPLQSMPYTSTQWGLDPYQQIAFVFVYASMVDGFIQYSIEQAAMVERHKDGNGHEAGNPYFDAMMEAYSAKWQAYLYDLARDVHIFGNPNVTNVIEAIRKQIRSPDNSKTPFDKEALGTNFDVVSAVNESNTVKGQGDFYAQLRGYMPDMGMSAIQLFNGRTTSRLERLRFITSQVGFEAYQDVDGGVIIKPPLYNLDVVNLDNTDGGTSATPATFGTGQGIDTQALAWMTDSTNPFVVEQSEILSEQETEDEANVRATRVTAVGSYSPSFQVNGPKDFFNVAEDIDIAKLAQFGLRTEPPKDAPWFRNGDDKPLYAYVASELARANRGFRYYSMSIPLRPEIKLGFPMYLPHKDMYGYIKSVTMSWTKGSNATTSVVLDGLRRRPLFAADQVVPNSSGTANSTVRIFSEHPNLVLQWTKVKDVDASNGWKGLGNSHAAKNAVADAKLTKSVATLPYPQQLVVSQQLQMAESRKVGGLEFTLNSDSATHNWRPQVDGKNDHHVFDYFRPLDDTYFADLRSFRPFTDQKGYELTGPFPWGRWKSLKESLTTFTIANSLYGNASSATSQITPVSANTTTLTAASAFLFAADAVGVEGDTSQQLVQALAAQRSSVSDVKVFELVYTADPTNDPSLGSHLAASAPQATPTSPDPTQTIAPTLLTGDPTSPTQVRSILGSVPASDTPQEDA